MGFCVPPSTPSSLNSSKVIPGSNQLLDSDSFIDQCSTTSRRSSLQSVSSQPPRSYTLSAPEFNQQPPTSCLPWSSLSSSQSLSASSHSPQARGTSKFTIGSSCSSNKLSSSQLITESCDPTSLDESVESPQQNAPSISATTGDQPVGMLLHVIAKGF